LISLVNSHKYKDFESELKFKTFKTNELCTIINNNSNEDYSNPISFRINEHSEIPDTNSSDYLNLKKNRVIKNYSFISLKHNKDYSSPN